jgi:hypothetical protein
MRFYGSTRRNIEVSMYGIVFIAEPTPSGVGKPCIEKEITSLSLSGKHSPE